MDLVSFIDNTCKKHPILSFNWDKKIFQVEADNPEWDVLQELYRAVKFIREKSTSIIISEIFL